MKHKLPYKRVIDILVAFFGSDIELTEDYSDGVKLCRLSVLTLVTGNKYVASLLVSRPTWEEVLISVLPGELIPDQTKPPFREIGFVRQVSSYRHVGKAIKRDCRSHLHKAD